MSLLLAKMCVGMVVGALVGVTGLGGGVLLLPLLIFGLGVPPIIAVGSDAAFNAVTKIGVGILHWHRKTVDWRLVSALSLGSIPGALAGVSLLAYVRSVRGAGVNDFLRILIGILLVVVPFMLLFQMPFERLFVLKRRLGQSSLAGIGVIGLFSGFLVGLTSVGSGSIIMVLLLLFVPCSPAVLVGTDIVHAFALTAFTSVLHLRLGTVDSLVVLPLLMGSVPGSLLGLRLSAFLPGEWLKRVLCVVLLATGARMLWV